MSEGDAMRQVSIEKILIEGGKASGIVLHDGRTVRARQFVASTLDVHQTFETLIGREQSLVFRTNVDDIVTAGPQHPLRFVRSGWGLRCSC